METRMNKACLSGGVTAEQKSTVQTRSATGTQSGFAINKTKRTFTGALLILKHMYQTQA